MQFFFYFLRSRFFTLGPSRRYHRRWSKPSVSDLSWLTDRVRRLHFSAVSFLDFNSSAFMFRTPMECVFSASAADNRFVVRRNCNIATLIDPQPRRLPSRWSEGPPNTGKECIIIMLKGALYSVKAMFSSIDLSFNIFRLYFALILACGSPRTNRPMMIRYAIDQFMESIRVFLSASLRTNVFAWMLVFGFNWSIPANSLYFLFTFGE